MKKISICLFDASFRENLHAPRFLNNQTVPRNEYEIIWIELYNRRNDILVEYERQGILDKLVILNFPRERFHNYPRAFNEAIVISDSDIWCMLEGDAICSPKFIESILVSFKKYKNIVCYIEGVRHYRSNILMQDTWETISNKLELEPTWWCNWNKERKQPNGIAGMISTFGDIPHDLDMVKHSLHWTNYGTCFSSYKKELINIGGADEDPIFLGAFNGAFEMGWRMLKLGVKEYWHPTEFIIHPIHPGTDGGDFSQWPDAFTPNTKYGFSNKYINMRLNGEVIKDKSLEYLATGLPLSENEKIKKLRINEKSLF